MEIYPSGGQTERRDRTGAFGKISRRLAVLVLGLTYFAFSFMEPNVQRSIVDI